MSSAGAVTLERQPIFAAVQSEKEARVTRGRPLIMLGLLAGSWVLARTVLWETPLPQVPQALGTMSAQIHAAKGASSPRAGPEDVSKKPDTPMSAANDTGPVNSNAFLPNTYGMRGIYSASTAPAPMLPPATGFLPPAAGNAISGGHLQMAASHQLMWMAAMAYMPVPKTVRSAFAGTNTAPASSTTPDPFAISRKANMDRWSLDAWTFWRQGSASPLIALGQAPSYGASQAGAVLRYELQPSNARRPRAYLRGYSSLEGRTEQEVAAGLSARPLPQLPLRLHAEARALRSANTAAGREISARAAAFVTTELPTAKLPAGFTAEAYGQAGYVTGKNGTAFADGQAHVLREVASFDLAKIEVGGAVFAGAQKGAHRVDIGPAMRVNLSLGETPARLSASYRAKVAGDAQPGSGVAVTLSTRF